MRIPKTRARAAARRRTPSKASKPGPGSERTRAFLFFKASRRLLVGCNARAQHRLRCGPLLNNMPRGSTETGRNASCAIADVAQLEECDLAKVEVPSSRLGIRSISGAPRRDLLAQPRGRRGGMGTEVALPCAASEPSAAAASRSSCCSRLDATEMDSGSASEKERCKKSPDKARAVNQPSWPARPGEAEAGRRNPQVQSIELQLQSFRPCSSVVEPHSCKLVVVRSIRDLGHQIMSCSSSWPRTTPFQGDNTGSKPVHDSR
jgi:hypothetical protein